MIRRLLATVALAGLIAGPAAATQVQIDPTRNTVNIGTIAGVAPDTSAVPTSDVAFIGEVALTVGVADTAARRSLKFLCASQSTIVVTYSDSSTGTYVVAGAPTTQTLPISISQVNSSSSSCTFANLK